MKISQAHNRLIRIIMTILSLASSLDLMYILSKMITHNNEVEGPATSYIPMAIYIILFIALAISYWLKNVPHLRSIRNAIIVITLGMTISSYLIAWPAFIFMHSTAMTMVNELLLAGTTIGALMANNLESFTSSSMVLLLFLKFITAATSLFHGAFVLANLAVGSNAILNIKAKSLVIVIAFLLAFWNVAYAVVIWLKFYHSWWAWVLSVLFILEVSVPLIWEAAILPNGSIWSSLMIAILVAVITLIMTYLNNFLSIAYQKMD